MDINSNSSNHGNNQLITIIASIVILIVFVAGCYFFVASRDKNDHQQNTEAETQKEAESQVEEVAQSELQPQDEAGSLKESKTKAGDGLENVNEQKDKDESQKDTVVETENSSFVDSFAGEVTTEYGKYTPETYALTGGKIEETKYGTKEYTLEDGSSSKNVWVYEDGKYYYFDFSGCLMRNNYTVDGFWVGDDGSWDETKGRRVDNVEPDSGSVYTNADIIEFEITNYSGTDTYGTVYYTYRSKETLKFNLIPMGYSTYLMENMGDFYEGRLISISGDKKTIIVSGYGDTQIFNLK